ncbi:MAG: hypothetical protein ACRYHQ_35770, partial [Janthinobacterium lividum]
RLARAAAGRQPASAAPPQPRAHAAHLMEQALDWLDGPNGGDVLMVLVFLFGATAAVVSIGRKKRILAMQQENTGLCASLRAATENVGTLRTTATEAQNTATAHKSTVDAQRHTIASQLAQIDSLKVENTELRTLADGVRHDLVIFQGKYDALELRRRTLDADLAASQQRNVALQDEVARLRTQPRNRRNGHFGSKADEAPASVPAPAADAAAAEPGAKVVSDKATDQR